MRQFNHPFLQAVAMFFGEFLCFLAYKGMYLYYQKKDYTNEMMPDSGLHFALHFEKVFF